ncbi:hypothetical protein PTKIN_Ptkin02bG0126800 [Pterospermum kingtungense]
MAICCDLEVDVNGKETFLLDKVATSSGILEKCLDSLVGRLSMTSESSPYASTSSPDSSAFRLSCDTRRT